MKESHYDRDPMPEPAAAPPQSDLDANVNRAAAVSAALRAHPNAGVDEIVAILARQNIEVSATLVMQEAMRREREGKSAP